MPKCQYKLIKWCPPPKCWWKCNTCGASQGKPRLTYAAFCVRDSKSDILVARGLKIVGSTNLVAEAIAIKEGLSYYFEKQLSKVINETNFMALVHIFNGE